MIRDCRSCLAKIVWMHTRSGKRMPIDATQPVALAALSDPQATFEDLRDRLGADAVVSHFATCPNAARHRSAR